MTQIRSSTAAVRADSAESARLAPRPATPPRVVRTAPECVALLLVSDDARRPAIADAVDAAGWHVLVCDSVGDAMRQADRWRTQLAVIELAATTDAHRATFQKFAEQLGNSGSPLVVISDERPTPADELWARQSGAWLYLPEMDSGEDLTALCRDALQSVRKQAASVV